MADNQASETIEIERKYAVGREAIMPAAAAFRTAGFHAHSSDEYQLQASYYDTATGALGRQRVALRRRAGGSDEGWHLKTKSGDESRERQWPLSTELPAGLRAELVTLLGDASVSALVPIATMHTRRHVTRWAVDAGHPAAEATAVGEQGQPQAWVIEIADDLVDAQNVLTGVTQSWREWEAELAPLADAARLDTVEPVLLAAGAVREHGTSKLQRIMGRPPRAVQNVSEQA